MMEQLGKIVGNDMQLFREGEDFSAAQAGDIVEVSDGIFEVVKAVAPSVSGNIVIREEFVSSKNAAKDIDKLLDKILEIQDAEEKRIYKKIIFLLNKKERVCN